MRLLLFWVFIEPPIPQFEVSPRFFFLVSMNRAEKSQLNVPLGKMKRTFYKQQGQNGKPLPKLSGPEPQVLRILGT
jgi:hypothetical protein